jgi:lysophospholipase L1-like esterase
VLILGGTNDLGWGRSASQIYDALVRVSNIPLIQGAKVLLFTVPEVAAKFANLDARRDELNRFIKEDNRENVFVFDLHAKLPYHSMPQNERKEIWDDGLHLTPQGYERMGELVAERLMELWSGPAAESSQGGVGYEGMDLDN